MRNPYSRRDSRRLYDALAALARDCSSELYLHRVGQRRGANVRNAFWDGYEGGPLPIYIPPGSLASVAFRAGRDFALEVARAGRES